MSGQTAGRVACLKTKAEELSLHLSRGAGRLTGGRRERGDEEKPCPSAEQRIDRFTARVHACCVAVVRAV